MKTLQTEVRVFNAIAQEYTESEAAIEVTRDYFLSYDTLGERLDVVFTNPMKIWWIAKAKQKLIVWRNKAHPTLAS